MRLAVSLVLLCACTHPSSPAPTAAPTSTATSTSTAIPSSSADADPPAPPQLDPDGDGDDDPAAEGSGSLPSAAAFERVGRAPFALTRICDLTVLGDALYAAHANSPLGTDGATITKYQPDDAKRPFTVAFDWNRPGEPTKGGGAGQGFLRVHAIGGRLFVPDADPPYGGLGLVDPGTEGYVFVSDASGAFAPARMPGHRPPAPPTAERAGAGVLPRAYHVLDAIRFRGRMYASTGSVPPKERAWSGPSPGALHVADESMAKWIYEIDYPNPYQNGVWRLGFMVRFRDRLYAGIQDYDGREPNDYLWFSPPADATQIRREDLHAVRVTDNGAALTVRWFAHDHKLWWIAFERGGDVALRVTDDGVTWRRVVLPSDGGRPTDVTRFRGALVVLTEHRLYRLDGETPVAIATIDDAKSPFAITDVFCAAPLAVYRNDLYAGGQRDGALYRLAPKP
jgi:hypothetical protein